MACPFLKNIRQNEILLLIIRKILIFYAFINLLMNNKQCEKIKARM